MIFFAGFDSVVIFAVAIGAFLLSAICGGGASLILLPLLNQFLPAAQVPSALSIGTTSSSLSRICFFWRHIQWHVVWWFLPLALPGVILGAILLVHVNPLYLQMGMGLFLVLNIRLVFQRGHGIAQGSQPSRKAALAIGFATGFVSGLTGAVGLLFNRFYLRYDFSKEQIVATRAANELLLHMVKLGIYALFGLLTVQAVYFGLLIAFAAVVASWSSKWVLRLLSEGVFRGIGHMAMVLSGVALLTDASVRVVSHHQLALGYKLFADGVEAKIQWSGSSMLSLEFELDGEIALEMRVTLADLPPEIQARVLELTKGADSYMLEEVFMLNSHHYEVYLYHGTAMEKFEI